jgi:radical SAM-linked protein
VKQRVRFTKVGKVRFLSHRDLARVWERGLRRAGVRVAYSEGFSPRPRLSFGLALSTGYESLGEYLDIDVHADAPIDPQELPGIVTPSLPAGMVAQVAMALEPGVDSLQAAVTSSSWELEVIGPDDGSITEAIERTLAADEVPLTVERKGSETTIDARPAILALAIGGEHLRQTPGVAALHPSTVLTAELATQPRSLRPAELLRALDPTWREGRVLRTHQWTLVDGARCEPIPFRELGARGATSTPHAGARAS